MEEEEEVAEVLVAAEVVSVVVEVVSVAEAVVDLVAAVEAEEVLVDVEVAEETASGAEEEEVVGEALEVEDAFKYLRRNNGLLLFNFFQLLRTAFCHYGNEGIRVIKKPSELVLLKRAEVQLFKLVFFLHF